MAESFTAALDQLERSGHLPATFSEPFVAHLPITGAAVSTLGDLLGSETISATDARAARLDELQFDLGEGPCWDSLRTGRPVVEEDVQLTGRGRWPILIAALGDEEVRSIFAFPLVVGPLRIGAVDLYSVTRRTLESADADKASAMAAIISRHILHRALTRGDDPFEGTDANPRSRRVVHQATGFLLAQLDLSAEDARLIIQGHAFATGRSMMETASEIVDGNLRFRRVDGRIEVDS